MSTRGTIEALIRDKLGVTILVIYLVWEAMQDISTIFAIARLGILVSLAGYTLYENHRHVEKMGNTQKSKDLIVEFKDHLNKELGRIESKPVSAQDMIEWLILQIGDQPAEEAEPKTQEEPIHEEPEVL